MSVDQRILAAALAVAAAVYLLVPTFRLGPQLFGHDLGARSPTRPGWLVRLLTPVAGAPSAFARAAAALTAGCAVLPLLGTVLPPAAAVGLAALVYVGLGRWAPADVRGRDRAVQRELPGVCLLLAVCLEAGLPLRNAVAAVADASQGPTAALLRRLHTSVRLGVREVDAWCELGEVQPVFADLARELGHAAGSGMALAPVLRHRALEARRIAHGAAQARARRAGVSSVVPLMVCFLPAFILIGVVPIVGGVAIRMLS